MNRIWQALKIAVKAHKGQRDKGGKPYIFHPIYVSLHVKRESEKIVALLHDVFEDTETKISSVGFLSEAEKKALEILTRDRNEDYFKYIEKVKQNSIARTVKLADLKHNMNLKRITKPNDKDFKRIAKYKRAREMLQII